MTFNLDIKAAVTSVTALEPFLEKSQDGSIIFMASTAAIETFIRPQAFNALKAALDYLWKATFTIFGAEGNKSEYDIPRTNSFSGRKLV